MVNGHIRGENKVTFSELRKAPQSQKHHKSYSKAWLWLVFPSKIHSRLMF